MNTSQNQSKYQVTPETTTAQIIDWILELKALKGSKLQIQRLQQALSEKSAIR